VAVVRLIVGRLRVGICGEGGLNVAGIADGASSLGVVVVMGVGSDAGRCVVLGEDANGTVNLGRNLDLVLVGGVESARTSWVSMRIGSFSFQISVVASN
jgi:hypothetical protein